MRITWINHASYIIEHSNIKLIVDPWLYGTAFNDGWSLLINSEFEASDFDDITHIWFSHEHPDHFSPSLLFKIPEKIRKKITVLFQETNDRRVINFCEKLSFSVKELKHRKEYRLNEEFNIICGKFGDVYSIDSWLLCKTDDLKILNLNDCVVKSKKLANEIKITTGEPDVLLTQFSYANWEGNPSEVEYRKKSAKEKLNRVKLQIDIFNPKYTIPFASFVYFSHEENKYLNDHINRVETASDFIERNTKSLPVVLYPSDSWDFISPHDSELSISKYSIVYNKIDNLSYTKKNTVPTSNATLLEYSNQYISSLKENNSRILIRILPWLPIKYGFNTLLIKLMDTGVFCSFDWKNGLVFLKEHPESTDFLELSSHSLKYIFEFQWGYGALAVNGRYRASNNVNSHMQKIFGIALLNSTDKSLTIGMLINRFAGKILGKNTHTEEDFSLYKQWDKVIKNREL